MNIRLRHSPRFWGVLLEIAIIFYALLNMALLLNIICCQPDHTKKGTFNTFVHKNLGATQTSKLNM